MLVFNPGQDIDETSLEQIEGVIFDLDGTLVESSLNFASIRGHIGCPPSQDILSFVDKLACDIKKADAHAKIKQHEMADAEQANWLPGAEKLVTSLKASSVPQAIVTRNFHGAAQLKVSRNRIPIDIVITREDAPPKPDPEALLRVARQWHLAVEKILYVGDYLYDIQAAKRAGMVACLYAPREVPAYAKDADVVCRDFAHLTAALA
ncbi:HAD family hydrolase [Corallincola platygyrae]|uniref:HAD family hydrolase n=1 Tax=Corallincola platygyrae TaxID=1193278 RepID=A0ABW4XHU8_9GAMM